MVCEVEEFEFVLVEIFFEDRIVGKIGVVGVFELDCIGNGVD